MKFVKPFAVVSAIAFSIAISSATNIFTVFDVLGSDVFHDWTFHRSLLLSL